MGQIGHHTFEDSTDPIATDTTSVGERIFDNTDNRSKPCNGTDSCSDPENDA